MKNYKFKYILYIMFITTISILMAKLKILPFNIFYAFDIIFLPLAFFFTLESFPYRTWKFKIYTTLVLISYLLYFITQSDILSISNESKFINITDNIFIIYFIPNFFFYFFIFFHINYLIYIINVRKLRT